MNVQGILSRSGLALAAVLLAAQGCSTPKLVWSQQVELNGRRFVFSRINSLREGPGGHRVEYRDGNFIIQGQGPIQVNGFEITAQKDGKVVLANQHLDLQDREEVHFSSDMIWKVEPGE